MLPWCSLSLPVPDCCWSSCFIDLMHRPWFLNDGLVNVFQPPCLQAFLPPVGAETVEEANDTLSIRNPLPLSAGTAVPASRKRRVFVTGTTLWLPSCSGSYR